MGRVYACYVFFFSVCYVSEFVWWCYCKDHIPFHLSHSASKNVFHFHYMLNATWWFQFDWWQHNFRDVNEPNVDAAGWRQNTIIAALLSTMHNISGKITKTKCCNCKIMEKFQKKMEKNMQNLILCKIQFKLISIFICCRCASDLIRAFSDTQLKFCSANWNGPGVNLIFEEPYTMTLFFFVSCSYIILFQRGNWRWKKIQTKFYYRNIITPWNRLKLNRRKSRYKLLLLFHHFQFVINNWFVLSTRGGITFLLLRYVK